MDWWFIKLTLCVIDNIESNISSIAVDTSGAADELTTAHDYQRKAGRRAACLMIILVVVVAIVLLAVRCPSAQTDSNSNTRSYRSFPRPCLSLYVYMVTYFTHFTDNIRIYAGAIRMKASPFLSQLAVARIGLRGCV